MFFRYFYLGTTDSAHANGFEVSVYAFSFSLQLYNILHHRVAFVDGQRNVPPPVSNTMLQNSAYTVQWKLVIDSIRISTHIEFHVTDQSLYRKICIEVAKRHFLHWLKQAYYKINLFLNK